MNGVPVVKRLSGMDAMFLSMEDATAWPQHTLGLMILDPGSVPGFGFDALRNHVLSRLKYLPQFRRRIQEVPFRLDRPVWVDDPDFRIDAHLHRTALPSPGGSAELADVIGVILARPLDRRRPLWEGWYLDGLEGGRVAFVAKTHHAIVDGVSGAGLSDVLCDLTPDASRPVAEIVDSQAEQRRSSVELLARAAMTAAVSPPKLARYLRQTVGGAVTTISHLRRPEPPPPPLSAPRVPFNGALGLRREFAYCSLALGDIKHVKNHFGVKVNDVILTVVAGAIRDYLVKRDALPQRPLLATVPLSTRSPQDMELGNLVHPMAASLATDIDDPVARLTAIHRGVNSAKDLAEALTTKQTVGLTDIAPPVLFGALLRAYQAANLEQRMPLNTNLIVSNVPGPPSQLFLAGARIEHIVPVGPLAVGMGMNVTVFSYGDHVDVGVQVDPELVDDAWELVSHAAEELDRLVAATADG
jgi:diacylglycerol O-acyltransferase / wax synthase